MDGAVYAFLLHTAGHRHAQWCFYDDLSIINP